jgi:hypothetical protein
MLARTRRAFAIVHENGVVPLDDAPVRLGFAKTVNLKIPPADHFHFNVRAFKYHIERCKVGVEILYGCPIYEYFKYVPYGRFYTEVGKMFISEPLSNN